MRSAIGPLARGMALAIAAGWLIACGGGGDDGHAAAQPTGRSMSVRPGGDASASGGVNRAPEIESLSLLPAEPMAGEPVRAEVHTSDPDGDNVTLEYHWSLNHRALSVTQNEVTLAKGRRGDRLSVSVVASDGRTLSQPASAEAEFGNRAPRLTGLSLEPSGEVRAGRDIVALPIAEDRDGDPIDFEFSWSVNGEPAETVDNVLPTQGLGRGDTISVSVVASDGIDRSRRLSSPPIELANAPPQVERRTIDVDESGTFQHQITARDPDGDKLLYRLRNGPEGMTVGRTTGHVEWTPTLEQAGLHVIEIEVDDLHGGSVLFSFSLTVGDAVAAGQAPAAPQE